MTARRQRGFTLVELMIVVAVIAILTAAVVPAVSSLAGSHARQSAGELAGSLRYLFDTAALRHVTCRMALDLPGRAFSAECAPGVVGVARDPDPSRAAADEEVLAERFPDERDVERRRLLAKSRFGAYTDRILKHHELPGQTVFRAVRLEGRSRPVTEGTAYVHFFPGGQAERAFIEVAEGDTVYTVVVEPFTGRARVVSGLVEADR
jgi:general secretion pathway protein H